MNNSFTSFTAEKMQNAQNAPIGQNSSLNIAFNASNNAPAPTDNTANTHSSRFSNTLGQAITAINSPTTPPNSPSNGNNLPPAESSNAHSLAQNVNNTSPEGTDSNLTPSDSADTTITPNTPGTTDSEISTATTSPLDGAHPHLAALMRGQKPNLTQINETPSKNQTLLPNSASQMTLVNPSLIPNVTNVTNALNADATPSTDTATLATVAPTMDDESLSPQETALNHKLNKKSAKENNENNEATSLPADNTLTPGIPVVALPLTVPNAAEASTPRQNPVDINLSALNPKALEINKPITQRQNGIDQSVPSTGVAAALSGAPGALLSPNPSTDSGLTQLSPTASSPSGKVPVTSQTLPLASNPKSPQLTLPDTQSAATKATNPPVAAQTLPEAPGALLSPNPSTDSGLTQLSPTASSPSGKVPVTAQTLPLASNPKSSQRKLLDNQAPTTNATQTLASNLSPSVSTQLSTSTSGTTPIPFLTGNSATNASNSMSPTISPNSLNSPTDLSNPLTPFTATPGQTLTLGSESDTFNLQNTLNALSGQITVSNRGTTQTPNGVTKMSAMASLSDTERPARFGPATTESTIEGLSGLFSKLPFLASEAKSPGLSASGNPHFTDSNTSSVTITSSMASTNSTPTITQNNINLSSHCPPQEHTLASTFYQRTEQYQQLSTQLADAVGQRLSAQIAKGNWSMNLRLAPSHLGQIDVKMSMTGGQHLDTVFSASNANTRDLLANGLSKLKDHLNQAGITLGQTDIQNGQQGTSSGNSSSHSNPMLPDRSIARTPQAKPATLIAPAAINSPKRASSNMLDVLV